MLYAYIDESYIDGRVYLVGALVLTGAQRAHLGVALDDVIWKAHKQHGVPLDIELHGQELFQRSGPWACLRETPKVAFGIYNNALRRVHASGGRVILRGTDGTDRIKTNYVRPQPPHSVTLQHLLERLEIYAARLGERVTIIADQVPDQAHHEARMREYQDVGTPGYRRARLANIEMPIQWVDSSQHRALQAIDLVTYVYLRRRYHIEAHAKVAYQVQRLRDSIHPAFEYHNVWIVPVKH